MLLLTLAIKENLQGQLFEASVRRDEDDQRQQREEEQVVAPDAGEGHGVLGFIERGRSRRGATDGTGLAV